MALRKVVEAGTGIAVLPDYIVEDRHALVQLIQSAEVPSFETYFVYAEAMRSSARLKVFRDCLVSKARQWQF
jgi:DNA-binding transcriptional LysR family regulator